jgi:hypothetical protein
MEFGDFSPNLYMVNYNIPVLRALITNFKWEDRQGLCSGNGLGVHWDADKLRPTNLKSDNGYPDLSFPCLTAASFKILLSQSFANNPSNWHYASEILTKSYSESLKFKIEGILIGYQNLTIIILSVQT